MRIFTYAIRTATATGLVLAAPSAFADPLAATPLPAAEARVRISVTENGRPLAQWPIHFETSGGLPVSPALDTLLTGPDGTLFLDALDPGSRFVSVDAPWTDGSTRIFRRKLNLIVGVQTDVSIDLPTARLEGKARLLDLPVPGALLSLYLPGRRTVGVLNRRRRIVPAYHQYADSRGQLSLRVPPGDYDARLTLQDNVTELWTGALSLKAGTTHEIEFGASRPNAGLLFGVVKRDGRPVPRLYLTVYPGTGGAASGANDRVLHRVMTSDRGSYLLPVPAGPVSLQVSDFPANLSGGSGTIFFTRTATVPANGRARADIDLHDKPLAGRVLRFHQPFSGAVVTVTRTQLRNRVVARTRTDVDGRFRLQIPGNSDVSVSVSSPGGVPIVGYSASASDPGARATWNSGNLTMDWEPRRVTGRILTKAGLPVADLPLRLDPNEGVEAGRTAADGTYAIDAPTYAFRLYVGDGKSWPFPPYSNSSHAIKARDWTLPEIPAQIHGRVRFARLDGSPGDPIPNAWVRLNAKNSRLLQTDSDGRFRFDGQPSGAGALDVLPAAPQNSWAPTLPAVPIASSRVNVKSGAIVNVDLVVPAGWIDVDAAVAGRSLIPQRIFIARAEAPQANRERVKFTMDPDDEGRLAALVPPGEYVVEYAPEADLLAPGVGTQLASRLVATVVVKPGERSPVHLVAGLLRPAWIADLRGAEDRPYRVNAGAARVGDLVIIGGEDGMLTAVRAKGAFGGTIAWRASLGGAVRTRPLAVGSRLFVATDDGLLHAFDIDERTPRHEALGYPVRLDAPLFVDLIWRPRGTGIDPLDGEVVAAGGGDSPALLVIDGRTGSILARHPLPSPPTAAPAIVGDQVVVPVAGRRMIAVDAKGSTTWEREFGRDNPGGRGPAVDLGNGLLVQGSDRGMIEALDSKTGAVPPSWPANSSSSLSASGDFVGIRDTIVPTANHRTLLAAAGNRGVLAVATSNGESDPLWPWTNPDPYGSPNRNPLRFSSAPLALVAVDGTERFCSTAILEPGGDLLDSLAVPILQSVSARLLSGVATFDPTERNGYGVLICAPMETPGNNYTAFYGDHTDRFIGRPVATGSGPEDSVVVVTEAGRVYGFSALGPQ